MGKINTSALLAEECTTVPGRGLAGYTTSRWIQQRATYPIQEQ
jgi:hypothetical protein